MSITTYASGGLLADTFYNSIAFDNDDNLYIPDTSGNIIKIDTSLNQSTFF